VKNRKKNVPSPAMKLLTQRLAKAVVAMQDARLLAETQMSVVESQLRVIEIIERQIKMQAIKDAN
jgi:hypothetical protein